MRLLITSVLSFFLFAGITTAQHSNIGVKGGLNAYTIVDGNNSNVNPKLGINLGLLGHFHIGEQFAFQPELVFSMQGAKFEIPGDDINLNLAYINIPLLFQYMFDNGFRIQAGPQLGVLARAKTKIRSEELNVKDDYESIDLALVIGLSYVDPATNFGVDLRYNHGLNDITKNDNSDNVNRGIQAGIFYLFNHE